MDDSSGGSQEQRALLDQSRRQVLCFLSFHIYGPLAHGTACKYQESLYQCPKYEAVSKVKQNQPI